LQLHYDIFTIICNLMTKTWLVNITKMTTNQIDPKICKIGVEFELNGEDFIIFNHSKNEYRDIDFYYCKKQD